MKKPRARVGNVTPARVRELMELRSPEQVAFDLGMDEDELLELAAGGAPTTGYIMIRNNRTGEVARSRSWRLAYRLAQKLGFADWDWWQERGEGDL